MSRLFAVVVATLAGAASAQTPQQGAESDDDFAPWTGEATQPQTTPPSPPPGPPSSSAPFSPPPAPPEEDTGPAVSAPPPPPPVPGPSSSAPAPKTQRPSVVHQRPPPREPNDVSVFGAPPLGQWKVGIGGYLGFPLLGVRAGVGVGDRIDVGLGFDSLYGIMNEVRAFTKFALVSNTQWSLAVRLEGGAGWFAQRPEAESNGARWLTGRRNFNLEPGVVASYSGGTPRSARLFVDVRYHLSFDTEPFTEDPLGGVPPSVQFGHNVPVRFGSEIPFSKSTSFLFVFGFDLHGRPNDSAFMPAISVGLVTGF